MGNALRHLRIGSRLVGTLAILFAPLCTVVGVGLSAMTRQQAAARTVAEHQDATRVAMQVKFRAADFNGWQTAYAFDVARDLPDAAADTASARAAFLAAAASLRSELAALRRPALDPAARSAAAAWP
jgi:methyl-accepting chemotaxis protein